MILDLSKSGLELFGLLPYEVEIMREIWRLGGGGSFEALKAVREKGFHISRPSVINSLQKMAFKGFLTEYLKYIDKIIKIEEAEFSGKTAPRWYTPSPEYPDEDAFIKRRITHVLSRIREEFPHLYSNLYAYK